MKNLLRSCIFLFGIIVWLADGTPIGYKTDNYQVNCAAHTISILSKNRLTPAILGVFSLYRISGITFTDSRGDVITE